ncbi:plasminogen activator inhibitor 1 RNA-binding protein-like isoform X2 [Thalassophryne amazonica]|uniref:plasminogen activator inhibitor 1 RNA-binding protein-like isoform X2 n=1 Tax=Thalassophryne amazonica TaxID=390379 RepID=UPI0014724254|nr:plasminogen activator inhibitor 1 RNA-binding protein-like isoform X2 [Thalassophryne amazonica]
MPGQMQEGFGCAITNRFDQLFDDESDPFELLKQAEEKKKKEASAPGAAKSAAQAAKQPKKESQKDRKAPLADKKEEIQAPVPLKKDGPGMRRVGRKPEADAPRPQGGQGDGRTPVDRRPADRRPPRRFERPAGEGGEKPEGSDFSVETPLGDRPMRGRGGGRGGRGGRGRGMGRGDGFDSRGKREFDRHSGSDRSSLKGEEKRGGSGSHNWGTVKDELNELDQSNVTEENPEGDEHPPVDSENKENEVEEVKDEGPKEMTLDEWKAMQDKDRTKVDFNIRKANEGAEWMKGFVLHKSKTENDKKGVLIESEGEESKHGEDEHHFRKPANDITSQLEINFGDLGRPGRGRGGPRGGRGGRGRGEPARTPRGGRSEKSSASVPNVDDPEAFPALA